MEGKVSLYNSDDIKIGETFLRRARQLVRRQRAMWVDDSKTAIRLAAGIEDISDVTDNCEEVSAAVDPTAPHHDGGMPSDWMLPMVEKLMRERRRFVVHTFIYFPLAFLFSVAFFILGETGVFVPFVIWVMAYPIHAYLYLTDKSARKRIAKRLTMEAELFKIDGNTGGPK